MLESMREELRCINHVTDPPDLNRPGSPTASAYHDSDSSGSTDGGVALRTINANYPPATATAASDPTDPSREGESRVRVSTQPSP